MKKVLLFILTFAMILTLPITAFAAVDDDFVTTTENDLKVESGNLANGATVYSNWSEHEGSGFNKDLITNGSLDGNWAGSMGMAWHSGNSQSFSRPTWIAIDFGKEVTIDTVVIYGRSDGSTFSGMPNAFSLMIPDSNLDSDGKVWIGDGCEYTETNRISYLPTGTVIYDQYAIDTNTMEAIPFVCQFAPVTTRYLVYNSLSQFGPWRSTEICEIAAYNKGYTAPAVRENLAIGADISSDRSHNDGAWNVANLIDGDRYNFNYSLTYRNDHGQFAGFHSQANLSAGDTVTVDLDLKEVKSVNEFVFWPVTEKYSTTESDNVSSVFPANYTIKVSEDNESWATVVTVTTGISEYAPVTHTLSETVDARYIRFEAVRGEGHIKISELEIYGSEASTPETPEDNTLSSGNDLFAVQYQTRPDGADNHDLRIVIIANQARLSEITSTATVKITFTLTTGAEISLTKKLGGTDGDYGLYRKLIADGDVYTAAEGYALFGNIITGIPNVSTETNPTYQSFTVEITDTATGASLLSVTTEK